MCCLCSWVMVVHVVISCIDATGSSSCRREKVHFNYSAPRVIALGAAERCSGCDGAHHMNHTLKGLESQSVL
uniref:Putative secreted protein n=1 Tax=Anopheles darlingi TaxID=43151 RepID=A0A2M4DBZ3_ANODA